MSNVYSILEEISSEPSTNSKIELIKENAQNGEFISVLDAALNPFRIYNIKKIPEVPHHKGSMTLSEFLQHLPKFEKRVVSGNAAKELLVECLSSLSEEDASVAARIIRKDLRGGFNSKTINKAIPDTIPVYGCLLARKRDALPKISFPAYSQIKADGMRGNIIVSGGNVTIRGRSGKFIDLYDNFDFMGEYGSCVWDGELLVKDENGNRMSRAKGNGILNKAIKGTISEEEASRVEFVAWDRIKLEEFFRPERKAPAGYEPYNERLNNAIHIINGIDSPKIKVIRTVVVNSVDEAMDDFDLVREDGEEGVIIKNMDHPWENRRSEHLVKIKNEKECELEVIGWDKGAEGKKWENSLGSLICASSDRKVVVSVCWFTDELREQIYTNIDDWMGRIVTVSYNERIKNETNPEIDSLYIPGLIELREDKDTADSSEDIE